MLYAKETTIIQSTWEAPKKVTNISVRFYSDAISLSWAAPASLDPIVGYDIQYTKDPSSKYISLKDTGSKWTTTVIKIGAELKNASVYRLRVAAKTRKNIGAYSDAIMIDLATKKSEQEGILNPLVSGEKKIQKNTKTSSWLKVSSGAVTTIVGNIEKKTYDETTNSTTIGATSGQMTQFLVMAPSTVKVGEYFDITVRAIDANGNTVSSYDGAVIFASALYGDIVPEQGKAIFFTIADGGKKTFKKAAMFKASGQKSISVVDLNNTDLSGQTGVLVIQ